MDLIRADSTHKDFIKLVAQLDAELADRDGEDHAFYHQYNSIDDLNHVLISYVDAQPVSIGAMKAFEPGSVEIKRMYTLPGYRGKGIATRILLALELWANELGYKRCVLETGKRQPEAIQLYLKNGYKRIANYGQYAGIDNSLCFEKEV